MSRNSCEVGTGAIDFHVCGARTITVSQTKQLKTIRRRSRPTNCIFANFDGIWDSRRYLTAVYIISRAQGRPSFEVDRRISNLLFLFFFFQLWGN